MRNKALFFLLFCFLLCAGKVGAQEIQRIKVACVGNSITFGSGIKDRDNDSYPAVLGRLMGTEYEVRNYGFSARTLLNKGDHPYMKEEMYQEALRFEPNIVIIKLGTNDSKPKNWVHGEEYTNDLESMVESFQSLNSQPEVYLCYPSKAYSRRFGINDSTIVHEIIPKIQFVAKKTGCEIIDLHTATEGIPEMYPDEIHPNAEGAAILAKHVHEAIILNKD